MASSNGTAHDNGHSADAMIDSLYAFWPAMTPAPQPCPEAGLSLTLKGSVQGVEALLTIRGQSPEEFQRNLASVKGLLDAKAAPQAGSTLAYQGEDWCKLHKCAMKLNDKNGRQWWSHKTPAGQWCQGK
jgi:hypothetical protein